MVRMICNHKKKVFKLQSMTKDLHTHLPLRKCLKRSHLYEFPTESRMLSFLDTEVCTGFGVCVVGVDAVLDDWGQTTNGKVMVRTNWLF